MNVSNWKHIVITLLSGRSRYRFLVCAISVAVRPGQLFLPSRPWSPGANKSKVSFKHIEIGERNGFGAILRIKHSDMGKLYDVWPSFFATPAFVGNLEKAMKQPEPTKSLFWSWQIACPLAKIRPIKDSKPITYFKIAKLRANFTSLTPHYSDICSPKAQPEFSVHWTNVQRFKHCNPLNIWQSCQLKENWVLMLQDSWVGYNFWF